jgi:uncharacterized protein
MTTVFADAGYWIALINPRDQLFRRARAVSESLDDPFIVTSEWVLFEVLNAHAEGGSRLRSAAVAIVHAMRADPTVLIVRSDETLFAEALLLYEERADKGWSMTDCSSFAIMKRRKIQSALSHDKHFEQAGFRALLR